MTIDPIGSGSAQVIESHSALQQRSCAEREALEQSIVQIFEASSKHYHNLYQLRAEIEAQSCSSASKLYQLVFHDLSTSSAVRILEAIHNATQRAVGSPELPARNRRVKILTDVDDTIAPSLFDRSFPSNWSDLLYLKGLPTKGAYPLASQVFRAIQTRNERNGSAESKRCLNIDVVALSARPAFLAGSSGRKLETIGLSPNTGLYGSSWAFLLGVQKLALLAIAQLVRGIISLTQVKGSLPDMIRRSLGAIVNQAELLANRRFAEDKRQNLERYRALFPDADLIFIGDVGEGDLMMGTDLQLGRNQSPDPVLDRLQVNTRYRQPIKGVYIHDFHGRRESILAREQAPGIRLFQTYAALAGQLVEDSIIDVEDAGEILRSYGEEDQTRMTQRYKQHLESDLAILRAALAPRPQRELYEIFTLNSSQIHPDVLKWA